MSTATVSRALAGKASVSAPTRAKVEAAANELGYAVSSAASSLASGRTRNVGVVMPFLTGWFFTRVLAGAHETLADAGYDLTLYHLDASREGSASRDNPRRERLFGEFLLRKRVDALITVSLELTDDEVERLRGIGKPVVGIGGPLPGARTMSIDDIAVARLATEHLLALGHRSIAHLGGDPTLDLDFHLPTSRRGGYEAALTAAGIALDPLLVRVADFTVASGYEATKQLLGDPRVAPTAIFAASDEMAIGAIMAARDLGRRVPADLSVVGIDGHSPLRVLWPDDRGPVPRGARSGSPRDRFWRRSVGDDHPQENVALPYELIVRSSTTAPPAAA